MIHSLRIPIARTISTLILAAAVWVAPSHAGTVLKVGLTDLLNQSQLVVHGRVVERWTGLDPASRAIYTHVRIAIDERIKGKYLQDHIVLSFMGGTHGNRTLTVSDMSVPFVGEEGIYFVERPDRLQVNPLFGWQQGQFVVRYAEDGATKMIMTHDLQEIYELQPAEHLSAIELSTGVPLGVRTDKRAGDTALTLDAFKIRLREISEVLR